MLINARLPTNIKYINLKKGFSKFSIRYYLISRNFNIKYNLSSLILEGKKHHYINKKRPDNSIKFLNFRI